MRVFRGHIFHITGRPSVAEAPQHLVSIPDGVLVVDGPTIAWVGSAERLPPEYAALPVTARAQFIVPGFVDTHMHYPQTFSTVAYGGGQLLEWLENCIFPAESRLADPEFADLIARAFVARRVACGTTAAMVFGSAFPAAQDAHFRRTNDAGLRVVSGRGVQTVGPASASALLTGETRAIDLVDEEISRWHAYDTADPDSARIQVAVVPRFALSVTPTTLAALGELYDHHRRSGVYFHTHLSENNRPGDGEIDAVKSTFEVRSYLDTYDGRFLPGSRRGGSSLLGRRSIVAHAVHCTDDELARLADAETAIAHCPSSQQFLGSGTMPWRRTVASGVTVAAGSDVGAGDKWLIPEVLNDCYKVHLSEPGDAGVALDPATLLFLGTLAGARALDMEHRFGNLDRGKDADFLLVDSAGSERLAHALEFGVRSDDQQVATAQTLFALLMAMGESAIREVYVQGSRVSAA